LIGRTLGSFTFTLWQILGRKCCSEWKILDVFSILSYDSALWELCKLSESFLSKWNHGFVCKLQVDKKTFANVFVSIREGNINLYNLDTWVTFNKFQSFANLAQLCVVFHMDSNCVVPAQSVIAMKVETRVLHPKVVMNFLN